MSLSSDMMLQAHHLASVDRGRPRQANLRRAITSAYYSFFHLRVSESVRRFSPTTPAQLAHRLSRAYVREEMKQVCKSIVGGNPNLVLAELQPQGFSNDLPFVAHTFIELQEASYLSDHDLSAVSTRPIALKLVERVEEGLRAWRHVRARDEATVFLTALLLAKKWAR